LTWFNTRCVFASVLDDLTQRLFDRARQDANADRLIFVRRPAQSL